MLQDILPVYPIVGLVAAVGDVLFVNTYYFWIKDVWDNAGTGYVHDPLEGTEKTVSDSGL